jgi:hypothetical protein
MVTGGYSSIKVSWSAPVANGVTITGYRASASPGPATCTVAATATNCVLGAEGGTAYTVSVVALSAGGSSPASGPSGSVVPSAPAVSPTPPANAQPLDTRNGHLSKAYPGQAIVVWGAGFLPNSAVTITMYSSPQVLATVPADSRGLFQQSVTVPEGLSPGAHTIVVVGVDKKGVVRPLSLKLTVASSGNQGTLPVTGPAVVWLIVAGFALTLAGVAMRVVKR